MKTNQELESIACNLHHNAINGSLLRDYIPQAIKELRSIELDAWREAREIVERVGDDDIGHTVMLAEMDRVIQQLQLK